MGHIYVAQKKYEDAEKSYKEALDQYKYIQYPIGKADVELNLAQMYYEKGDWDNAAEFFGKAASTYSELGNKEREASCVASKAYAEAALEDPDSALNSLDHAIMLYGNINDSVGVANAKSKKGLIYYYEKRDFECAERLYMEALEGFREGKDKGGESSQLANLGTLYYETKQLDKAQKEYESALSILRNINNPIGLAGVLSSIGYVYEQKKNYVEARSKLREAYDIYETFEMEEEMKIIEDRITSLEKKAGKSLEDIRSELFPGLGEKKSASGKKRSKKSGKIGRNDPCPCGSGKKYKACCGAN
jgi:tetratricopeptide (TPR) repeat protein